MKYVGNKDYLPSWLIIAKTVMKTRQIDMLVIDPGCSCCQEKQIDIKNADDTTFSFLQVANIVCELCKAIDNETLVPDEPHECHQPGCPMEECS
jgi:hypothetical protein